MFNTLNRNMFFSISILTRTTHGKVLGSGTHVTGRASFSTATRHCVVIDSVGNSCAAWIVFCKEIGNIRKYMLSNQMAMRLVKSFFFCQILMTSCEIFCSLFIHLHVQNLTRTVCMPNLCHLCNIIFPDKSKSIYKNHSSQ